MKNFLEIYLMPNFPKFWAATNNYWIFLMGPENEWFKKNITNSSILGS